MDGILNINKSRGRTSFNIVAGIRRLSGEKHVGHAGTLDPDATGVLPVCLGKGTRIIEYLVNTAKTYRARIEFGAATDTYDGSGSITRRGDASGLNRKRVEAALEGFRGSITQTPPMYSAVKHKGQPLYKLARAGITVPRKSRKAIIHRLEIISWRKPVATVVVECSKGTYIRSLAHDLGEQLDCGAFLKSLVRIGCGIFDIDDAVTMSQLEEAFRRGYGEEFLHPVDSVLRDFPAVVINEASERAFKTGMPLNLGEPDTGEDASQRYCRAYSGDGRFLGILKRGKDAWQPKKVLV